MNQASGVRERLSTYKKTRFIKIADCGRWVSGGTPRKSEPQYWGGTIPWISAKSLKTFELSDSEDRVTELGAEEVTLVPPGTILFVVRGMSLAKEFRVGITTREVTFNQDLRGIIPSGDVDARYLTRILHAAAAHILGRVTNAGHGTKRLPTDDLKAIEIPMPSLPEQRRIAGILDAAGAIRRKRQQAIGLTEQFLRSTFLDMFGDPVTNPKGWPVLLLGDLVDAQRGISYGIVQRGSEFAGGIPVIRISNIRNNNFDASDIVRTDPVIASSFRRTQIAGNELLLGIRGTIGNVAKSPMAAVGWNVSREIAVIPLKNGIDRDYVMNLMLTDAAQNFLTGKVRGIAQRGINLSDVRNLPVPIPSDDVLHAFINTADRFWDLHKGLQNSFLESTHFFNSLVQRAFRGEL